MSGHIQSTYDDSDACIKTEIMENDMGLDDVIIEGKIFREALGLASAMFHVDNMAKAVFRSRPTARPRVEVVLGERKRGQ